MKFRIKWNICVSPSRAGGKKGRRARRDRPKRFRSATICKSSRIAEILRNFGRCGRNRKSEPFLTGHTHKLQSTRAYRIFDYIYSKRWKTYCPENHLRFSTKYKELDKISVSLECYAIPFSFYIKIKNYFISTIFIIFFFCKTVHCLLFFISWFNVQTKTRKHNNKNWYMLLFLSFIHCSINSVFRLFFYFITFSFINKKNDAAYEFLFNFLPFKCLIFFVFIFFCTSFPFSYIFNIPPLFHIFFSFSLFDSYCLLCLCFHFFIFFFFEFLLLFQFSFLLFIFIFFLSEEPLIFPFLPCLL